MIDSPETPELPRKDKFIGFTQGRGTGIPDLKKHLGVRWLPEVATYFYDGYPKGLSRAVLLARVRLGAWQPIELFLESPEHRGFYDSERKAIFVKPNDPFAEAHEAGHAFVHDKNPKFDELINTVGQGKEDIRNRLAYRGLDEGIAQWMAVAASLRTQDPARVTGAIIEHNKYVGYSDANNEFAYDPNKMAKQIGEIKDAVEDYIGSREARPSAPSGDTRDRYKKLLYGDVWRQQTALGYAYTASRVEEDLKMPNATIETVLSEIAKNPPKFAEVEEQVLAHRGPLFFPV